VTVRKSGEMMPSTTAISIAPAQTATPAAKITSRAASPVMSEVELRKAARTQCGHRVPAWRMALAKFWAPVPWMLELQSSSRPRSRVVEAAVIAGLLYSRCARFFQEDARKLPCRAEIAARAYGFVLRDGAWKIYLPLIGASDTVKLSLAVSWR